MTTFVIKNTKTNLYVAGVQVYPGGEMQFVMDYLSNGVDASHLHVSLEKARKYPNFTEASEDVDAFATLVRGNAGDYEVEEVKEAA